MTFGGSAKSGMSVCLPVMALLEVAWIGRVDVGSCRVSKIRKERLKLI